MSVLLAAPAYLRSLATRYAKPLCTKYILTSPPQRTTRDVALQCLHMYGLSAGHSPNSPLPPSAQRLQGPWNQKSSAMYLRQYATPLPVLVVPVGPLLPIYSYLYEYIFKTTSKCKTTCTGRRIIRASPDSPYSSDYPSVPY